MSTKASVTVVGSLNEDVTVTVPRLPSRGETVLGSSVSAAPGGKGANQAAAAGRRGAGVRMIGRVGSDVAGDRQLAALVELGVDVSGVRRTRGVPTGTATVAVEADGGENLIVVAPGANAELSATDVGVEAVRQARVLLLQLETPLDTIRAAAASASGIVVLNPAPAQVLPVEFLASVEVLVPNEHELLQLVDHNADGKRTFRPIQLVQMARSLTHRSVVVTLGSAGALVIPALGPAVHQLPLPVAAVDTTGAGDCFCGALALAMSQGAELLAAVACAAVAASLSTTAPGARGALPDANSVHAAMGQLPPARYL